jgi:hypothetical protein
MKSFPESFPEEFKIFKELNSPVKIQDFLDKIPLNFERGGDTNYSPFTVLKKNKAHCMEGAMLAAAIFWYHGEKPLIMDLKTTNDDTDHVVAVFKQRGRWGAISKTNHAVLRYREPVYKNLRELAMSYFHEYFLDNGKKTLRSYSELVDLSIYGTDWLTSKKHLWKFVGVLNRQKHFNLLENNNPKFLRKADQIEIAAGKLTEWKKKN